MFVPIFAHAADFLPLIPIPIAIVALLVYARRERSREQPSDAEKGGLAAVADMTLLGVRTLRDRFRGSSKKDT